MTPTNADRVYDELLRGFLESVPDVRLNLIENPSAKSVELLLNGDANIVFTPQELNEPHLETLAGYQSRIALGIASTNPLASKDMLSIYDIFDVSFGSLCAPMPLVEFLNSSFSSFGKKPHITVRSTSLKLLKPLVQDGQIAVALPDDMMRGWENVSVIAIDFFRPSTHKLVWNKIVSHNSVFSEFLSYAKRVFGENRSAANTD